ncbi:M15 family metallopeptidase [Paenibacillus sp. P22]|uniref:M15 family metallopeptidase n=1 Tax=Paenibacillus sp. P22 TaxID=483908 RepID=UPI0009FB718E|nr:M15 family metallopeptidase [Paenibacillus sp. P22]
MTLTLDNVRAKSSAKLIGLFPVVAAASNVLIERCYNRGVPIVITQGLRTYAEQDALYTQGRTKPGAIVTNARGGYSNHNFGVAIDFALLLPDGRTCSWDTKRDGDRDGVADWNEVVAEAKRLGFEWGGDWRTFTDLPHFEMTFGISTAAYRGGQRPTAAQVAAAYAKINEGATEMKREDADAVIAYLKTAYGAAKTAAERKELGRLADVLRVASGQQPQNK